MDNDATRSQPDGGLAPQEVETPVEQAPVAVEPEIPAPTPAELEKAERLIREANIAKIRKQTQEADRLLKEAMAVAPGSASVLEAVGDDLLARGQTRRALEVFGKAHKLAPDNAALERKYAECVLATSAMFDPLNPGASLAMSEESLASYKTATLLSFVVPGLGQLVTGNTQRGAIMLGGFVLGWLFAFMVEDGVSSVFGLIGLTKEAPPPLKPIVLLYLGMAACFHLWSIMDMATKAKMSEKVKKPIDRPLPPVDMPFE